MTERKPKSIEYRLMANVHAAECEFCNEPHAGTLNLYVCRESGTENYRDYPLFAHGKCFADFLLAQFDEVHQNRGL